MIYKGSALSVLIDAPLIVVAVQTVLPARDPAEQTQMASTVEPDVVVSAPAVPVPLPHPSMDSPAPAPAGQPMAQAGRPMLTPGAGLPAPAPAQAQAPVSAPVEPAEQRPPQNF